MGWGVSALNSLSEEQGRLAHEPYQSRGKSLGRLCVHHASSFSTYNLGCLDFMFQGQCPYENAPLSEKHCFLLCPVTVPSLKGSRTLLLPKTCYLIMKAWVGTTDYGTSASKSGPLSLSLHLQSVQL